MNTIQPLLTIVLTLLTFLAPQLITLYFSTKRKAEADKARAAAAGKAATHEKRADYTLGLRPQNPADMCASMQALGDKWLQGRAQ